MNLDVTTPCYNNFSYLNSKDSSKENLSKDLVSKATSTFIIKVSSCGLLPVITILGILGNIISFIVFLRQRRRDRTRVLLIGLAISDICYLSITFVRKLSCIVSMFDVQVGHNWGQTLIPQWYVFGVAFARITSVITMVISIERCFAVLFPLKVRVIITRTRALKLVMLVFVSVVVLMVPLTLTSRTIDVTEALTNNTVTRIQWTEFYLNHKVTLENYMNVVLVVLLRIIPSSVVLVCTTAVLISLKQGQKFRKASSTLAKSELLLEEKRVTVMLLCVTTLYTFCLVPGTVVALVRHFVPEFSHSGKYVNTFLLLSNINIVLECMNSALPYIIYIKTNKRFNVTIRHLFCGSCSKTVVRNNHLILSNGTLTSKHSFTDRNFSW